jgi:hypothetical protein
MGREGALSVTPVQGDAPGGSATLNQERDPVIVGLRGGVFTAQRGDIALQTARSSATATTRIATNFRVCPTATSLPGVLFYGRVLQMRLTWNVTICHPPPRRLSCCYALGTVILLPGGHHASCALGAAERLERAGGDPLTAQHPGPSCSSISARVRAQRLVLALGRGSTSRVDGKNRAAYGTAPSPCSNLTPIVEFQWPFSKLGSDSYVGQRLQP